MSEAITALSETMFAQLQKEKFIMLNTLDAESGGPSINAISWVYAVNSTTIRLAVDQRSRLIANVKSNPSVIITFFGSGTVNAVYGKASIVKERLEEVPIKLACIDIAIDVIRDAMFYGAKVTVEPEYEKTYDKRAADRLDTQVFAALKKA